MKPTALFLLFSLLYAYGSAPVHERWDVKTLTDGFTPNLSVVKKITVAQLEPKPKIGVRINQPRLNFEKQVIQITGTISKRSLEADGDYHIEVTDGSMGDSALVCEAVDPTMPVAAGSPMINNFNSVRGIVKGLHVGDRVRFTGMLFQDRFHSPSPNRIRNFLEIHPILKAVKLN